MAQPIDRIFVEHPTRGVVHLHVECGGINHVFEMKPSQAVTVADDLNAQRPANLTEEIVHDPSAKLPDTLSLPLLTRPFRTASMTDYPDGMVVEGQLQVQLPSGAYRKVRIPMFAQDAKHLIGAIGERLNKIGQGWTPPKKN